MHWFRRNTGEWLGLLLRHTQIVVVWHTWCGRIALCSIKTFPSSTANASHATRSSAIAEGPHDTLVSRNLATTKYPIWKDCNWQM